MHHRNRAIQLRALQLSVASVLIGASTNAALAAECAQWNVAGKREYFQSNVKSGGWMDLQQDGTNFKGSIGYSYLGEEKFLQGVDAYYGTADIVGTVVGNKFEGIAYWRENNKVGIYSGQIGPQGLVVGRTFNKNNPAESADWHGSPAFDCLTASAPNPPASGGNSGKPSIALGRTNAPTPPPLTVSPLPGAGRQTLAIASAQPVAPIPGGVAAAPKPSIAEPRDGGRYPQQTPLRVRIAAARDATDTAYRVEIQVRENILIWHDVATLNASAAVAQSPQGFTAWGGKPGEGVNLMTAMPGVYRVRASATGPQTSQPGDWVTFTIDGLPANQVGAMNQPKPEAEKAGGVAQPAMSGQPAGASSLGSALAVKNKADAASLNSQPLPPKTTPGAVSLTPQPLGAATLSGATSLNPQPLPPKLAPGSPATSALNSAGIKTAPVLLNPQPLPPGGLQQAPSSLR